MAEMDLNTRIVHSLLDMNEGEEVDHLNITVIKRLDGGFEIWDDGDAYIKEDVNDTADFIEENLRGGDWPEVVLKQQISTFAVEVRQFNTTVEPRPTDEQIRRAVHQGLILQGFNDLEALEVTDTTHDTKE